MSKKTIVIGASENEDRYSNKAIRSLRKHSHEVIGFGLKEGKVLDVEIRKELKVVEDVDTVSLYVGPDHQESWKQFILDLKPKRVIFNPGTENPVFEKQLSDNGIETTEACTLVLLSINAY